MKQLTLLVALLLLAVSGVFAQEAETTPEPSPTPIELGLCDAEFSGYILDVPCDWLNWKQDDYVVPSLGVTAYTDLLTSVDPRIHFAQPPDIAILRYFAIAPQLQDDQTVMIRVTTTPLSEAASSPEAAVADTLFSSLQVLEFQPLAWTTVNGRLALIGITPWLSDQGEPRLNLVTLIAFPEDDVLALVLMGGPPEFFIAEETVVLVRTMLTSLRLAGEEYDLTAIANMRMTAEE